MTSDIETRLANPAGLTRTGDAIGFVGPDVPVEVLLASRRPFGHLPWRTDGHTPWADEWLESGFPGWARSILEQWHDGAFDGLHTVVFSRSDDAAQRLFYYVRELQQRGSLRGPQPLVFDMSLVPRASSLANAADAVLTLCKALDVAPSALPAAIRRANELRRALQGLQQRRAGQGAFYERLARAALWNDPSGWIGSVAEPASSPAAHRVLLAGSMPPDDRLHAAVEAAGASVVAEAHAFALDRLRAAGAAGDVPALIIARQLTASSVGPRAFFDRAGWLVAHARDTQAEAVILWLTREDEALAWQVPAQRKALAAAGIPALILPASHWLANDRAPEHIMNFCRETFG
ncbi:MAG: 2-hydroxyacyl-CoA dehydratase family protein [Steroidobacteraceae bacterium]